MIRSQAIECNDKNDKTAFSHAVRGGFHSISCCCFKERTLPYGLSFGENKGHSAFSSALWLRSSTLL